jgi:hypothetical protein
MADAPTAREREAYENGRRDRTRAIIANLRHADYPLAPTTLSAAADFIESRFLTTNERRKRPHEDRA